MRRQDGKCLLGLDIALLREAPKQPLCARMLWYVLVGIFEDDQPLLGRSVNVCIGTHEPPRPSIDQMLQPAVRSRLAALIGAGPPGRGAIDLLRSLPSVRQAEPLR